MVGQRKHLRSPRFLFININNLPQLEADQFREAPMAERKSAVSYNGLISSGRARRAVLGLRGLRGGRDRGRLHLGRLGDRRHRPGDGRAVGGAGAPGAGLGGLRRPLHGRARHARPADRAQGARPLLSAGQVRRGGRLGDHAGRPRCRGGTAGSSSDQRKAAALCAEELAKQEVPAAPRPGRPSRSTTITPSRSKRRHHRRGRTRRRSRPSPPATRCRQASSALTEAALGILDLTLDDRVQDGAEGGQLGQGGAAFGRRRERRPTRPARSPRTARPSRWWRRSGSSRSRPPGDEREERLALRRRQLGGAPARGLLDQQGVVDDAGISFRRRPPVGLRARRKAGRERRKREQRRATMTA